MHAIQQIPNIKETMKQGARLQRNLDSSFLKRWPQKNSKEEIHFGFHHLTGEQVFLFVEAEECSFFLFLVRKSRWLLWFGGKNSVFILQEGSMSFGTSAFRLCAGYWIGKNSDRLSQVSHMRHIWGKSWIVFRPSKPQWCQGAFSWCQNQDVLWRHRKGQNMLTEKSNIFQTFVAPVSFVLSLFSFFVVFLVLLFFCFPCLSLFFPFCSLLFFVPSFCSFLSFCCFAHSAPSSVVVSAFSSWNDFVANGITSSKDGWTLWNRLPGTEDCQLSISGRVKLQCHFPGRCSTWRRFESQVSLFVAGAGLGEQCNVRLGMENMMKKQPHYLNCEQVAVSAPVYGHFLWSFVVPFSWWCWKGRPLAPLIVNKVA